MEILVPSYQHTMLPWWQFVALVLGAFALLSIYTAFKENSGALIAIGLTLLLAALPIFIFAPWSTPTGIYTTTIEITDSSKYEELVNAGYSFTRIYDNRNIYKITGDEIK